MSSNSQLEEKNNTHLVRLNSITFEANGVLLFELTALNGRKLKGFSAGSHIDIYLPNGLTRQYSLCNSPLENHRYVVAVKKDPLSRGGSNFMHDELRVGTELKISEPRNNFELSNDLDHTVLIGGGIGVTPLVSMAHELTANNRSWQFFCSFKRRSEITLVNQFQSGNVLLHIDEESENGRMDIASILKNAPIGSHFYCCGPEPMLNHFIEVSKSIDSSRIHFEYFKPVALKSAGEIFEVKLHKTKKNYWVNSDQTILQVLQKNGIAAPGSCEQGICGTCETHVLDGIPDHRDVLLSAEERASNQVMMICCSRSLSTSITLDL